MSLSLARNARNSKCVFIELETAVSERGNSVLARGLILIIIAIAQSTKWFPPRFCKSEHGGSSGNFRCVAVFQRNHRLASKVPPNIRISELADTLGEHDLGDDVENLGNVLAEVGTIQNQ